MAPFRFRLEQVLLYRKQLEDEAMQALSRAVLLRDELKERLAVLHRELDEQRRSLSRPDRLQQGELALLLDYCRALERDAHQTAQALALAETHVDEQRALLVERSKERGLLDSLKEKQAARHLQLERQHEQQINDETATLRYKPVAI